ncbi:hypothetical protein [Streptomyces sp. NRRL S-87]|uniref:hypothetical protein n=1 Tax=Streptomyces sp. NRRL S-87 TaxID=1463920 RepID=UPI00068C6523|nr:hypothetical protein [Streptomyces sp. NRRL S-87]
MRTTKSRSRLALAAAGSVLASLALSAPAAQAAAQDTAGRTAAAVGAVGSAACTPGIKVLASLPGPAEDPRPWMATTEVRGIGRFGLSVGRSQNRPVYWTGKAVHAVPLPKGYATGLVEAVNKWGVMVGTMSGPGLPTRAFRYAPGFAHAKPLPGGERATDINDHGHSVGYRTLPSGGKVGLEWAGGTLRRELVVPAHTRYLEGVSGINNAGRIVGNHYAVVDQDGYEEGYESALLWSADAAAPAAELPEVNPGDSYSVYEPRDIDEAGRIAGTYRFTHVDISNGTTWLPPYSARTSAPNLGDRTQGTFEDISPTTNVSVGTASDSGIVGPFPPETAPPYQAQLWKGSGPVLALPRLANTPTAHAGAYTVTDDDRVGGYAVDAADRMHPVIWTCASKQAHLPTSGS